MKNSRQRGIILTAISVCLIMLALELVIRIHNGKVFDFKSLTVNRPSRVAYHARLGWVPRPGRFGTSWTCNVNASGLRSNGRSISTTNLPILAVGDSFTFGDEVEDSETWAAHLEEALNKPVLNAGVDAYGIDQAVLRAELLLENYHPDIVILSFISDDINRTEFSYYPYGRGWKPYFEFANGSLSLRNVPVPQEQISGRFQTLRLVLGHSFLANFIFSRTAQRWWHNFPPFKRIHNDGENVSVALLARLQDLTKKRGAHLIAISLATNGRIGGNARLPKVVKRARENGIQVLDLSTEMLKFQPDRLQHLFRPAGHYSPAMNSWIADHIAEFLRERGIVKRAYSPP